MSRMLRCARLIVPAAIAVFLAPAVQAAACTSAATGNWSAAATWAAPCNVAGGPVAADTVTIAAAHTVTVDVNSAAASLTIAAPSVAAHGVNINPGIALNVGGAVTLTAPAVNGRTSTLAVGSGTLTAASIAINSGTNTKVSQVTVSTGTITTTGSIAFAGTAANARLVSTGASMINIGGNLASGGTLTTTGTGTINFNGGVAQTMGAYATYNNVAINNAAGGVALAGNATIGGTLAVNTGTLTIGAFTFAVTGATTVNGAISVTSTTGTKTFTGNVTINSGGTLSETVAEPIAYGGDVIVNAGGTLTESGAATMTVAGNFQNDGAYTASTGVHTFSGAAKTFSGTNPIVIPSVTVSGTYQNNGTLTVGTALAGAGTLTNAGTLNIGGTSAITGLTANAIGNTVNYSGAAQTIKAPSAAGYYHLTLSGSNTKTMPAGTHVVAGNFTLGAGVTYAGNTNNPAISLAGDFTNGGTFNSGTGVFTFNGSALQTLTGATAFTSLAVNNTGAGLQLANDITATTAAAGTLALTSGVVTTGTNTLIVPRPCNAPSVTRTSGHVAGNLRLQFPTGAPSCTFHVGDATAYRPINAAFASVTAAGPLTGAVSQAAGDHPNIATSGLDSAKSVNRYWTLTNPAGGAIAFTTYTATFNFINPADIDAGATATNFEIERWDGAAWNVTTLSSATATSTAASGLPAIAAGSSNSFAAGEKKVAVVSINRTDPSPTNAASVSWTVTFTRSVSGVGSGNFDLVPLGLGGTPAITAVSEASGTGSNTVWTVTASTGTGNGTLGLNMANGTGVSPAVTNLPFTNGQVYAIDKTVPVVSSITRVDPTPTALASVSWDVTFSESVTGVDAADFVLAWAGGAGGGSITSVTGSGAAWVVTASTGVSNGMLGLNLVDDDSILDATANPLGGAGAGNGNFTGEVYTLNFTAPAFMFTDASCVHNVAFGAPTQTCMPVTWSPQVAGQNSPAVYITAVSAAGIPTRLHASQARTRDMQFGLTCHDPVADAGIQAVFAGSTLPLCQASGGTPAAWSAIVPVTFNAGIPSSAASYVFNYADVGRVELWMRNNAAPTETGFSGPFVVKPGGFVLSGIQQTAAPNTPNPAAANATGTKFVKAGEAFSATVTAMTCSPASATCIVAGAATPNYGKEVAAESVALTPLLAAGLGLTNNPVVGGSFGAFANGVATGTAFTWSEVGIITLTPSVADADYLGAGDIAGTATGNVGRFYAAQFSLSGGAIANRTGLGGICAAPAGCDTFTYMGEQMSAVFNLTAQAADGTTTLQNYAVANNFAKFDPTAAGNPLALGAVDTGTVVSLDMTGTASGSFASGVASVTAPFAVTRGASTSGPFDALAVGVAPVDGDGAALATLDLAVNAGGTPNTHGMVGSTRARYGRMKISSAHGSELLKLPIPMEVQYWQGQYWVQNSLDDATTIIQNNVKLATISGPAVTISSITKDAAGKWRVILNKPLVAASSNVCLDLDTGATGDTSCQAAMPLSMPFLQTGAAFDKDPVSRATFGVYKGNDEFIYLREVY